MPLRLTLAVLLATFACRCAAQPVATLVAPHTLEPGQSAAASVSLDAPAAAAVAVKWTLRAVPALHIDAPPDPVYGADHARGALSRTEAGGKVIESGSLTDGKDYTDASTPWASFTEALQYVDLGRARRLTRIAYLAGNANQAWKLDVACSRDGAAWTPVPGLQGMDVNKRWGEIALPLQATVEARHLRLRWHRDGETSPVFCMPCRLSVYDGIADERPALPTPGILVTSGTAAVRPGATRADLPFGRGLEPGLYLVAALVTASGRSQVTWKHVMVLPRPMPGVSAASRFGLNGADGRRTPLLKRLGVGWVRFENLKWPFVSPAPGEYHFDGTVTPWEVNADALLRGYRDAGLEVLPFLFMTAPYASSAPTAVEEGRRMFYPPRSPADFAEFAFQVAARYGARAHPADALKTTDRRSGLKLLNTYEVWNEPNLTDPVWGPWVGTQAQYMDLLRAASEAIKRADPAARVTNAGYAGIQVKTVDTLRTHLFADGKRPLDFIDVLNVHTYTGRVPPEVATEDFNAQITGDTTVEADFRRLAAWRARHKPGLPIWLTETGYDSAGPYGTDEATQAARLPRVVMLALANGMDKVFVYRESGSTPSMHAAAGLVRDDGAMKPSYLTYATLIRELNGVSGRAARLPHPDPNVRLYLWKRGAEDLLTAWTVDGTARIDLNLGTATVTDAFGRRARADLRKGLDLTAYPVYVRGMSERRGIEALQARAARDAAASAARRKADARLRAYLFKFGGPVDGTVLDLGRERTYTPVASTAVYTDATGFGFSPGPAGETQDRAWVRADLDRVVVKWDRGHAFRVLVAPGRYAMRLGVGPYDDATLTVEGVRGGAVTARAPKGDVVVEATIEAPGGVLTFTLDNYSTLRWLTLVELRR